MNYDEDKAAMKLAAFCLVSALVALLGLLGVGVWGFVELIGWLTSK